jgi:MoaA/NifB/PqqE/SkfB family radical SAM enzyme
MHCFNYDKEDKISEELSLNEIRQISENMGKFFFLNLTGGEPYLRQDLAEIIKIFSENNDVKSITTPTNGMLTDDILSTADQVLTEDKNTQFSIDVSLDEIGAKHDEIRSCPGLFEKAVFTFNELKKLKTVYSGLNVGINVTLSAYNQKNITEIYEYISHKLQPDTITVLITRGTTRNKGAKDIDIAHFDEIEELERKFYENKKGWGGNDAFFSLMNPALNKMRRNMISEILKTGANKIKCYAGNLSVVLASNGDVYPCELLDTKMGNLRESNYDLKKMLVTEQACACSCTHECNLTTNILFNPYLLIKLIGSTIIK